MKSLRIATKKPDAYPIFLHFYCIMLLKFEHLTPKNPDATLSPLNLYISIR